ncbi:hypothetical protein GQ53DRAFT_851850 [Thozetella sp. PMI_491]|nr:hypothetical protein GQ53DRAFT_851850 [Thozetella sp. PMI_491]
MAVVINTRGMRYTGVAMAAMKSNQQELETTRNTTCKIIDHPSFATRPWSRSQHQLRSACFAAGQRRSIGEYPLTSELATWVLDAMTAYKPTDETLDLVKPFAAEFHERLEQERASSTGFHDINIVELTYQVTLEVSGAVLLAATKCGNPVDLNLKLHSSRAASDDHFAPWGKLLTGLECDPPIISQFPFYLMMCHSFGLETGILTEDYVYSALTGVDWAKGKNVFSEKIRAFERRARDVVPKLDDKLSGRDRSFWRIALAYLAAINDCENSRTFKTPKDAAITHDLSSDLVIAARAFDTIGSAYMCSDGAAFLDNAGMDSLIGSALPNDVMDLHTDIVTGETRNLLRLLYPSGLTIDQCLQTMSTVYSGMLCEIFRGHKRARFNQREDGRISATSPPYSFCRARHRRIFETLEAYINRYPLFWEWTWEIYNRAKAQITEAGLSELLVNALKRASTQGKLRDATPNKFYDIYFDMIENGEAQMQVKKPLGVGGRMALVIRDLYDLWHVQLLSSDKQPGWGREFDEKSDALLGEAGVALGQNGSVSEETFRFAIAYGRLSMALPYVAYHTVDAIIMAHGVLFGDD